ncbi:hypothetical protein GALL_64600 [mine drainage metagenome]|uniref:AAA+ ATPase domain-containing protein n=1 Tax=mine drainage metagenome TaxID=410659 RepID=A0A1J5SUP9_9ZZZZ
MHLELASRKKSKIKLSLAGSSGSGKTYSAISLAYGLCNDFKKICLIDSENFSGSLYSHRGEFYVINISAPFHPAKYVEAIQLCEKSGIEIIIVDGITHEWSGKGGCLELHEAETSKMRIPNSFTAWAAITPLHQKFIDAIVNSSCHVITTVRSKTEYVLTERNGKQVPQKVGMAPITRDGFDFEQTIAFDLDHEHKAFCTKDRTGMFQDQQPFVITPDTGKKILHWCNSGESVTIDDVSKRINDTVSIKDLLSLYQQYPQFKEVLKPEFEQKKRQIIISQEVKNQIANNEKISSNGIH